MSDSGLLNQFLKQNKLSIPAKVFYNHFYAALFYIKNDIERLDLKKIPYFNKLRIRNDSIDLPKIRKLLWNAWSTEYALALSNQSDNEDYYKFSLHWNFPQAYYSIYLAMTAFHETQGVANDQHEKSIKLFGNAAKDNHYPACISYFSSGLYKDFSYHGLIDFNGIEPSFSSLGNITTKDKAQQQIATFLKSTREHQAKHKRDRSEKSYARDQRFQNAKGDLTKKFTKKHWDIIYSSIPETTLLNLLYRLRIKANYLDIETFINADIDFVMFHKVLCGLVNYMNYVHEGYIRKAIGEEDYLEILGDFKGHINDEKALKRNEKYYNEVMM
ncbi:MAG: hypothetical protein DSY77_05965 [Bacteroidetes bacterium]|nr:MAG: hypothetical protein DSY77_05965 [Bacteroidota bacterium]